MGQSSPSQQGAGLLLQLVGKWVRAQRERGGGGVQQGMAVQMEEAQRLPTVNSGW